MTRPEATRLTALAAAAWHSPTLTTWVSMGVRLASLLLVLPLALARFSAPEVAVWQLFATVLMLMMLFDFGLAPTFARMLALTRGGASLGTMVPGDRAAPPLDGVPAGSGDAVRLMSTLRWLYPRIALGIVAVFSVAGTWALIQPMSQLPVPRDGWWAWGLVLGTSALALTGQGYGSALLGMDRTAVLRRWETACGLGQIVTSVLVLSFGGGLLALVASYQAWAVFNAWRNRHLLATLHPELMAHAPSRDPVVLHTVWPAAWRSGAGVLMSHGLIHASGLVYAQLRPAGEVAAYLLALRFAMAVSQFSQAPFYTKLPRLAELHAGQQQEAKIALAQRGMRWSHWVFVAATVGVAVVIGPVLTAIGSETAFVDARFWAVLSLAFFVERYGAMHIQLYSLCNRIVWHIASGVTGVLLCLLVAPLHLWAETLALPLAMLLSHALFYAPFSARLSLRLVGSGWLAFERPAALAPALAMAAYATAALLGPPLWAGLGK